MNRPTFDLYKGISVVGAAGGAFRGFLLAAAAAVLVACTGGGPSDGGQDGAGPLAGSDETGIEEQILALRARAAELEATLAGLKAGGAAQAAAGAESFPETRALLEMAGRRDGPALSAGVEKLLLGGEAGFARLHEFFHAADVEHDKIDAITHHPQLIFAMLRLVALYPGDVAAFSSYLMKATKDHPESWLRREYFNFLPVFLLHHEGRYAELRRDLEEDIVDQIRMGGAFLYKVALAMRDMDFKPPADIFYPLLADPGKRESHGQVIELLRARGEEGLQVLKRYLAEAKDLKTPTIGEAVQAVAHLEGTGEGSTVAKLLEHDDPDLRGPALFAYFRETRDEKELPRVIDFLNSHWSTLAQKRAFISLLVQRNAEFFEVLAAGAELVIVDEKVQEALRRSAEGLARRKARREAAQSRTGQSPPAGEPPRPAQAEPASSRERS
jgi:hypothetical protein